MVEKLKQRDWTLWQKEMARLDHAGVPDLIESRHGVGCRLAGALGVGP